jgi:hypothetical protein
MPEGQSWPLYLVFCFLLIGGIIGLIEPKTLSSATPPDRTLAVVLVGGALAVALLLYIPSLVLLSKVYSQSGLGNPAAPAPNTLLGRLQAIQAAIGTPDSPQPRTLLGQLEAIRSKPTSDDDSG